MFQNFFHEFLIDRLRDKKVLGQLVKYCSFNTDDMDMDTRVLGCVNIFSEAYEDYMRASGIDDFAAAVFRMNPSNYLMLYAETQENAVRLARELVNSVASKKKASATLLPRDIAESGAQFF